MNIPSVISKQYTNLSLPLAEKKAIANQLTQAAIKGIKELHLDNLGNTIIHDAIHLNNYTLFQMIFKDGKPTLEKYVNVPNSEGATPLLEAAKNGDYPLVKALIAAGASESFLVADHKGLIPLQAAAQSGNAKLVKYLIKQGTSLVDQTVFAALLNTAILNKDVKMVEVLLRYAPKESVNIPDRNGLTPKQRAIILGQISVVKLMLEAFPKLAETINRPDSFGVTDLQRAARSGNMEMMSLLLSHCAEEEIKVNPEAFFTVGDLEACLETTNEIEKVKSLPIEKVAFPLTVIQNYCSVMIGLADGKILQIRNADAKKVRDILMQKKYGQEWKSDQGANVLTFFLSPGHGFLRLECSHCDENKPYNINSGFYPKGLKIAESRLHFLERQLQARRESKKAEKATKHMQEETVGIEEANLIFTIAKDERTVEIKTPVGKTLTMNQEDYQDMIQSIMIEEANVAEIAQATFHRLKHESVEGGPQPDYEAIESLIERLYDLKMAASFLADWTKANLRESGKPLEGKAIASIVQALISPGKEGVSAPLSAYFNSTLSSLAADHALPLVSIQGEDRGQIAALLADLMRGLSMEEVLMRNFSKSTDATPIKPEEAKTIAEHFIKEGSSFTSKMVEMINQLPHNLQQQFSALPDAEDFLTYAKMIPDFVPVAEGAVIQAIIPRFFEFYLKTQEQGGMVANEAWYEDECDSLNVIKIMVYVDDEQAKGALNVIKDVSLSCHENPEKSCRYHMTSRNCLDFLQDVFQGAGGRGDFVDYLTDEQLGYGHLFTPGRLYEFKSLDYGFIRSRGWPHYLAAGAVQKMNRVFNQIAPTMGWKEDSIAKAIPLPSKIVPIQEALPASASDELSPDLSPQVMAPYTASLSDNVSLAFVIAKMAANTFSGIGSLWTKMVGEKVSETVYNQFVYRWGSLLLDSREALDSFNIIVQTTNEILEKQIERSQKIKITSENEAEVAELLESLLDRKERIIKLQDQYIDLATEGLEIHQQLKRIGRSYTLPTKKYLTQLEERIQNLADETEELKNFSFD